MADLVVPQLGESITEAVVAKWLKQVGESVAVDEPLVDLETDKITVQLPSPVAGVMAAQRVLVGATVKVGDVLGTVEAGAAKAAPAPAEKPAPAAKAAPTPAPSPAPPAAAPSTRAPATRPPATQSLATQPGAMMIPAKSGNGSSLDKDQLLRLTPSQRANAREVGVIPHAPGATNGPSGPSVDDQLANRLAKVDPRDEVVPMSPLRKRVAERLVQAQHESASLTTFNEVDMSAVMDLRAKFNRAPADQSGKTIGTFEKAHGAKLGFMSFFVKACVAAAKLYPGVNAEVIGGNIVYKKHYDFGIAVGTPKGLVVPVLRDCDTLSFAGIEKGILELAERARNGKLTLADLTGGTFTITNGGIYGSMMSTPLLNYPQTGILGMHNIVKRAVVISEEIKIRPMMYLALSYDHRVVDGKEAVSFLVAVKDRLESPDRMLVEV